MIICYKILSRLARKRSQREEKQDLKKTDRRYLNMAIILQRHIDRWNEQRNVNGKITTGKSKLK